MWYTLLLALQQHLQAQDALSGVVVRIGDSEDVPSVTTLVLLRGANQTDHRSRNKRGKQTLYVEAWVNSEIDRASDAATESLDGYVQLAALETSLIDALHLFGQQPNVVSGYHIRATIKPIEPDGDAFRPYVASRVEIELEYTKINV